MTASDYHMHTFFSDGKASPTEMACAALEKGMTAIGFTDHCCAAYDDCGIPYAWLEGQRAAVRSLQRSFAGKLDISCGIEQDLWSDTPTDDYDYVIGSVHYLKLDGKYYAADDTPAPLQEAADMYFNGDYYCVAKEYYREVILLIDRVKPDIIGHFDLIAKLNSRIGMFDENDSRYRAAWQPAADALLEWGRPFEINTGAISRGYRTVPYPAPEIAAYLIRNGAQFILSSDAHTTQNIGFEFDRWEQYYKSLGAKIISFQ